MQRRLRTLGRKKVLVPKEERKPPIRDERNIDHATAEAWAREYLRRIQPHGTPVRFELVLQNRVLWLWRFRFEDQSPGEDAYWLVGGDMAHMMLRGNDDDTILTAAECLVVYSWLVHLWYRLKGEPGEDAQPLWIPGSWEPIVYADPEGTSLWLGGRDNFVKYKVLPDMLHDVHNPEIRDRMSRLGLYEGMFDPEVQARLKAIAAERDQQSKAARAATQRKKKR